MAISSTSSRNDYTGTSSLSVYAYSFRILLNTHLLVTVRSPAGVESTLTLTTDYTVSGVLAANGGNVTLVNASQAWLTAGTLTTGWTLTIRRVLPLTQTTDIRNQGDFFPETHENEFDRHVMVAQQQQDEIDRSLTLPETEPGSAAATTLPVAATRASKYLYFDASGNPTAAAQSTGVTVTAAWQTVLDDASIATGLTTARDALLAETAPAAADEVILYDASALTVDRMTLENLFKVITALTAETAPAVADELAIYDASAATADKITLADMLKVVDALTEDTSPVASSDFLLSYDTSAAAAKKIKPSSIYAPIPTRQTFLTGSGTYTTPTGARQLRVRYVGGGGGGAASATNAGSVGGNSSFNSIVANGGSGGPIAGSAGGAGGTGGAGTATLRIAGGGGGVGHTTTSNPAAVGGNSAFGGGARGALFGASAAVTSVGAANSGGGGGGASDTGSGGCGGGAGEYVELTINSPAASYAYAVGAGGAGGAAGGFAGGAGGSGIVIVDELY